MASSLTRISELENTPGFEFDADRKQNLFAEDLHLLGNMLGKAVAFVHHDDSANEARPAGFLSVIWVGTVEPNNMANNDIYLEIEEEE